MQRKGSKAKRKSKEPTVPREDGTHPAGDDPEAQKRWNKAMGLTKEDRKEEDSLAVRQEKQSVKRLMKANGGLEDWVYYSGNLMAELIESLEEESSGLEGMLDVARDASRFLSDENWARFQEVPRRCIHALDKEIITGIFSAAEPQWRTLLTTPKKGGTCVFLHIGTEPPTTPIIDLLTKLGWFGVCVCAEPPAEGNEDRIQHCQLDPYLEEDEAEIVKLQVAKGSLLPKPASFMLAFADVVWDSDNIDNDMDQASLFKQIDGNTDGSVSRKEFRAAQKLGMVPDDVKFKTIDINGDGSITRDEFAQAVKRGLLGEEEKALFEATNTKPAPPMDTCGYGLLGVTWSPEVRYRLRMLRNTISVALQRLSNQGSLVITWHGVPHHPALLFITSQLRPVFLRVHVLVPEGTRSWETWILAASFKRSEAEEVASKGSGGFMFKNFIDSAYRCADLDDCLLWSLPVAGLLEEYRLGGGERTIAKGYNELWTNYAQKFRDLLKEMGSPTLDQGTAKKAVKPKPRTKEEKDSKSKAKAKPKPKAKAKADEEPAAAAAGETEGSGEAAVAATLSTTSGTLPAVASAKPKAKAEAKSSPAPADTLEASPEEPKRARPKSRYVPSRSLPSLACTFGGAPGAPISQPSEYGMSQVFPLIARAMNHLEKNSRIVARIDKEDIKAAMKMTQTAKYMTSEEGSRAEGLVITLPKEAEEED